jgi:hypothetical protein
MVLWGLNSYLSHWRQKYHSHKSSKKWKISHLGQTSCFLLALKLDIIKIKFMSKNTKNHFHGLWLLLDSDSVLDLLHDLSILNSKQMLTSRWFVNLQQKFNFNFFFLISNIQVCFPPIFHYFNCLQEFKVQFSTRFMKKRCLSS